MQQNLNFGLKSSSSSILLSLFSSDTWLISFSVGRGFELIETRSPSCCELRIDADEIKNISFSYGDRFQKSRKKDIHVPLITSDLLASITKLATWNGACCGC